MLDFSIASNHILIFSIALFHAFHFNTGIQEFILKLIHAGCVISSLERIMGT